MMDIYAMEKGRPCKVDEIGPDVWINMINPTSEEIDLVQSALGIDREALTAALDDEEGSDRLFACWVCKLSWQPIGL